MSRLVNASALAVAIAILAAPFVVDASDPFLQVLSKEELARAPSQRYARMDRDQALAELRRRGVIFDEVPDEVAPGVVTPIRLTARLDGVLVHGTLPPEQAATSPFEILDARLALALGDFTTVLKKHDVVEVIHFTMYRPGGTGAAEPVASHPRRPRLTAGVLPLLPRRPPPVVPSEGQTTSRHPAGLAIDVGAFKKSNGETLSIARHFEGKIGAKTCGPNSIAPKGAEAKELLSIVCEAADLRLFTYMLTPHFNAAHRDHVHMEIKAGVPWMLVH